MRFTFRRVMPAAVLFAVASGLAQVLGAAGAPAAVMIWPIHPVIGPGEPASALWLENKGTTPIHVQIRVLGWSQENYTDEYRDRQDAIVASPPAASIEPGRRQLVRLTKLVEPPAGYEMAYRVLVDELPRLDAGSDEGVLHGRAAMGVQFRMRYSLPLFVHGAEPRAERSDRRPAMLLSWRIVQEDGRRWLQFRNAGARHARISHVRLVTPDTGIDVATGLLGYVLPGSDMRWPVPDGVPAPADTALEARINGGAPGAIDQH